MCKRYVLCGYYVIRDVILHSTSPIISPHIKYHIKITSYVLIYHIVDIVPYILHIISNISFLITTSYRTLHLI